MKSILIKDTTREERQLLERFAELPFLPVIWNDAEQTIAELKAKLAEANHEKP